MKISDLLFLTEGEGSHFMPADVKHKKAVTKSGMLVHEHHPKHNEDVHNHLKKLGFSQNGASHMQGSSSMTEYHNKSTGMSAYHHKGKTKSVLEIQKHGS